MNCARCGRKFDTMRDLDEIDVDVYAKITSKDVNGRSRHTWKHVELCPECSHTVRGVIGSFTTSTEG